MLIEIIEISKVLNLNIPDLITRPVGKKMYNMIRNLLKGIKGDEALLLDFKGIKVIDTSCIDEFLVKLIFDSRKEPCVFFTKLLNISDITEMNIDSVLNSYYTDNKVKLVVMSDRLMKNNSFFIGHLSKAEKDVVDFFNINKTAKADEMADFLKKDIETTIGILEELYSLRVIRKIVAEGKQLYQSV